MARPPAADPPWPSRLRRSSSATRPRHLLSRLSKQTLKFEYSEADRWRLAFIRRARQLGFTLGEIGELLGPAEARSTDEIVRAAQAKLDAIEEQARNLAVQRCKLRRLVQVCEHGDGDDCVALRLTETDVNGKER